VRREPLGAIAARARATDEARALCALLRAPSEPSALRLNGIQLLTA